MTVTTEDQHLKSKAREYQSWNQTYQQSKRNTTKELNTLFKF